MFKFQNFKISKFQNRFSLRVTERLKIQKISRLGGDKSLVPVFLPEINFGHSGQKLRKSGCLIQISDFYSCSILLDFFTLFYIFLDNYC